MNIQKPFLKWVGGKSQIINKIIEKIPNELENYHELFLGGGSVLLAVLSLQKQGKINIKNKIYAYDINERLINVYKKIQSNKDELFELIQKIKTEYDSCPLLKEKWKKGTKVKNIEEAKTSKQHYYYWLRDRFNGVDINMLEDAALFIVINKLCFRGLYRESRNGFNVPFGNYKSPNVISKKELDNISELIKNVEFISCDFSSSIKNIKEGDFVYLDPPYAPESETSFVNYTNNGFDLNMHKLLFKEIKKFGTKIKFAMSNAKVDLVTENFTEYSFDEFQARRAINSRNPADKTMEIIVYN